MYVGQVIGIVGRIESEDGLTAEIKLDDEEGVSS